MTAVRAFRADISQMNELYAFLTDTLRDAGVPKKIIHVMELVTDEIFSNIARHAYGSDPARDAEDAVVIELKVTDGVIEMTFSDRAHEFNPLSLAPPDLSKGADREPGGLGIYIARSVMDDVRYSRREGRNVLTLVKFAGDV